MLPGKKGSTVTLILSSPTGLGVSFPIRLDSIFLRTLLTLPLFLSMFSAEMLLYSGEVSKSSRRVMVDAGLLGANINLLLHLLVQSLLELPGKVVTPSVKLQILVSLETLVAYFADETVFCH